MILIALGSNLSSHAGDPAATLRAALTYLSRNGVTIAGVSRFYRTPAWPDPRDPEFVNAVASVETELSPAALIARLHETETSFGRVRSERNAPRTLDLDILDYDGRVEDGPPVLPHPRIESRAFVLVPMQDVAPAWRHPVSGRSIPQLLSAIPEADRKAVIRI
ncbi:MAG: 2-amino-4-hydroxy-6-hydroxymethyldihydropteridine diphosphokinase [Proteobacteria bacterium]|nr:2-amino-4-hydroxy-6-hydroxymethyldihydropteridine diphosphokinase [Pseudomonadota bacterium]